jgi:hypothetical protein
MTSGLMPKTSPIRMPITGIVNPILNFPPPAELRSSDILGRQPALRGERKTNKRETATYQMREIDPDDANDVIAGLNEANFSKWIVVEDFHYLPLDTQRKFATYLKAFFENSKIRFIIVAIWTGKNRITTVGDLASRVIAVDVDFWPKHELMQVIENGEKLLNIQFPKSCKDEIIKLSEGSVYIVQEVCQALCQQENVFERQRSPKVVRSSRAGRSSCRRGGTPALSPLLRVSRSLCAGPPGHRTRDVQMDPLRNLDDKCGRVGEGFNLQRHHLDNYSQSPARTLTQQRKHPERTQTR